MTKFRLIVQKDDGKFVFHDNAIYDLADAKKNRKLVGGMIRPLSDAPEIINKLNGRKPCTAPVASHPLLPYLKATAEGQMEAVLREFMAQSRAEIESIFFGHENGEVQITLKGE